jgi:hypothetical protein
MNMVRCKICIDIKGKEKLLTPSNILVWGSA